MELNRRRRRCATVDADVKVSHEFNVKKCEEEAASSEHENMREHRDSAATVCRRSPQLDRERAEG
jgi:hypothetical protein